MSAQLSGLSYGSSLAYPRPAIPARSPGQEWEESGNTHQKMALAHWAAAYSCPDGQEQDFYMKIACAEERAEARFRAKAAEIRQAHRYPARKVAY